MEVREYEKGILVNIDNYNLGKVFRYPMFPIVFVDNETYIVEVNGNVLKFSKLSEGLYIQGIDIDDYLDEYKDILFEVSGKEEIDKILINDFELSNRLDKSNWLVKPDLLQMIIMGVLSENNTKERIETLIYTLNSLYGEETKYGINKFPNLNTLLKVTEDDFKLLGFGYRSEKLIKGLKILKRINDKEYDWESYFLNLEYEQAKELLAEFDSITNEYIEYICLYGLGHTKAFPINKHIKKNLFKIYSINVTKECNILSFAKIRFGNNIGYANHLLQEIEIN